MSRESKTACLRPFASDGLPILGKTKQVENVIFATGHYKNGFGLAPVTGKLISQLVIDGETKIDVSAFSPDRFPADTHRV
jgi:glycine/D-amino acid oxidase-like deaminating enzyme